MKELEVKVTLADDTKKGMEVWLARDKNGEISAHLTKPNLWYGRVYGSFSSFMLLGEDDIFPEVTFENSPKKARIILED
jgi:hypothetical protein